MITRDQVIELATQAGIEFYPDEDTGPNVFFNAVMNIDKSEDLYEFAKLVAAMVREGCAYTCDDLAHFLGEDAKARARQIRSLK